MNHKRRFSRIDTEPVILIAMERGSRWPSWAREGAPDAIVLAQQPAEDPIPFAERVARRLAKIPRSQHLVKVVVAIAEDTTREALVARCLLSQAALRYMDPDAPDLVLVADKQSGHALRGELFGLAGALCEQLGTARAVTLSFGHDATPARRPRLVLDTTAQVIASY